MVSCLVWFVFSGHHCKIRQTPYFVESPTYESAIPIIGMDSKEADVRSHYLVSSNARNDYKLLLQNNPSCFVYVPFH